jgi:PilZ domain-containing protein
MASLLQLMPCLQDRIHFELSASWGRTMAGHPDRRKLSRLLLEVPMQIAVPDRSEILFGQTANVSAQGIFFHTTGRLNLEQEVECVLVLPENLTLASQPTLVGCKGKVVRVSESHSDDAVGIAIEVNSYDFSGRFTLPSTAATNNPAAKE